MKPITLEELNKKKEELRLLNEKLKTLEPIITELKEDERVKKYIELIKEFDAACNVFSTLSEEIKFQSMYHCQHYFVINSQGSYYDGHRYEKSEVKTCIHCGLTNRYMDYCGNDYFPYYNKMNEVFINSGAAYALTHGFYDFDEIKEAEEQYKRFKDANPTATDKQIEKHLSLVKEIKEKKEC